MEKSWEDHQLPPHLRIAGKYRLYTGTALCVLGTVMTLLGYLELWSVLDLVPASRQMFSFVVYTFVGFLLFRRGEKRRWQGQMALSRLSDHWRRHHGVKGPKSVFDGMVRKGTLGQIVRMSLLGTVITGFGGLTISACFLSPLEGFAAPEAWALRAGLLLLGACQIAVGNTLFRRSVRLTVGVLPSFKPLPAGSYVLYLRNFSEDLSMDRPHRAPGLGALVRGWFLYGRSEERRIAATLGWFGPVLGVGAPGERVPNDGILRMYLPDEWQPPVRTLIRDARLVILVLGHGAGTLWELGESMRVLPPARLVLMNPMGRVKYEEFREIARQELRTQADKLRHTTGHQWTPPDLPDLPADRPTPSLVRGIIHFTEDWRPAYVALPRIPLPEDHLLGALDRALWAPMLRLTAHEQRGGTPHG